MMQHELEALQERRREAEKKLGDLHEEARSWAAQIARLHASAEQPNRTFPDLQTLDDWVGVTRKKVNAHGKRISEQAWEVRRLMADMDRKIEQMIAVLGRPESARIIGLSMFFKAPDEDSPPQTQASTFVRWLETAALEAQDARASGPADQAPEVPELFEFTKLPYQGAKDIGGGIVHRVYTYHGRFTRPP